jgi:hypothetical protein
MKSKEIYEILPKALLKLDFLDLIEKIRRKEINLENLDIEM